MKQPNVYKKLEINIDVSSVDLYLEFNLNILYFGSDFC